jgi:hypothetical protein
MISALYYVSDKVLNLIKSEKYPLVIFPIDIYLLQSGFNNETLIYTYKIFLVFYDI